jgi:hypothetical protein
MSGVSEVHADGHVHFYEELDIRRMLEAARERAASLKGPLLLLLAESSGHHYFEILRSAAQGGDLGDEPLPSNLSRQVIASLGLAPTAETTSVRVDLDAPRAAEGALYLVAGRQFVSTERLEVLGLFLDPDCPVAGTGDGTLPADVLIPRILETGAVATLPWGVGKWLGARGRAAQALAESWSVDPGERFFLGDIAHRCWPWPTPRPFLVKGARVLPGTDLLPLPGTEERLARYGFRVSGRFDAERPAASLVANLSTRRPLEAEGAREPMGSVLREQLLYQAR